MTALRNGMLALGLAMIAEQAAGNRHGEQPVHDREQAGGHGDAEAQVGRELAEHEAPAGQGADEKLFQRAAFAFADEVTFTACRAAPIDHARAIFGAVVAVLPERFALAAAAAWPAGAMAATAVPSGATSTAPTRLAKALIRFSSNTQSARASSRSPCGRLTQV